MTATSQGEFGFHQTKARFEEIMGPLGEQGVDAAFNTMIEWYSSERCRDASDDDGDMLLFEFGTFDWGEGRWFEVTLTRQIATSEEIAYPHEAEAEEDDEFAQDALFQLRLTFRYSPSTELDAVGSFDLWTAGPESVGELKRELADSDAIAAVQKLRVSEVTIDWENCE